MTNMGECVALDLIVELCRRLAAKQIDYCHWKSNTFLNRSASGANDLDLLINRRHSQCFIEVISGLGFKETLLPQQYELPGVRNYYGYDRKTGCLVHVHAHFQLVGGSDLSKNYHLPLEQVYLRSAIQGDLFRAPSPEFELVVFVIRMVLKHSTWDSMLIGHGTLSSSEQSELKDLAKDETLSKVDKVLSYLPGLSRSLFDLCLRSLEHSCPYWTRVKAGEQLQHALQACSRYPHWYDIFLKFFRRIWQPILLHIFRSAPKNRFANSGLLIAIVGGDGAGKTTLIDDLHTWLSGKFEIEKFHMGKPNWSWTTCLIRGTLKIGTLLHLYRFEGDVYEEFHQPHGYPWFLRSVCTARDRYLTYIRARRKASNGGLVLCDRYPFPGFMTMDGPQCEQAIISLKKASWFHRFLARLEKSYYERISSPDILVVLRLNPKHAAQRKREESEISVLARSTEVWERDWTEKKAFVMDAGLPREEVLAQGRALLWAHL
jgi:thymidylate kinase